MLERHFVSHNYVQENDLVPVVGLGVTKSRLEWEEMEVRPTNDGALRSSIARFSHHDMALVQAIEEDILVMDQPLSFDDIARCVRACVRCVVSLQWVAAATMPGCSTMSLPPLTRFLPYGWILTLCHACVCAGVRACGAVGVAALIRLRDY